LVYTATHATANANGVPGISMMITDPVIIIVFVFISLVLLAEPKIFKTILHILNRTLPSGVITRLLPTFMFSMQIEMYSKLVVDSMFSLSLLL
jgi:hypothetical protein